MNLATLLKHMTALPQSLRPGHPLTQPRAVIRDLYEHATGHAADAELLDVFTKAPTDAARINYFAWVLAASHLLFELGPPVDGKALRRLLLQELASLSAIAKVNLLDQEEERREELIRRCLRALGRKLDGETDAESDDRWKQVDSIERHEVLVAAAEREKRQREVREAMAKKAAEEAVPKVGRE